MLVEQQSREQASVIAVASGPQEVDPVHVHVLAHGGSGTSAAHSPRRLGSDSRLLLLCLSALK